MATTTTAGMLLGGMTPTTTTEAGVVVGTMTATRGLGIAVTVAIAITTTAGMITLMAGVRVGLSYAPPI